MRTEPAPPFAAESVDEPDRATLDPAVAALLDFAPAERKIARPDGWTPARQRRFIALLAELGSPRQAAEAMDKDLSGVRHLYRSDGADSFRAAWKAAMELAARRRRDARANAPRFTGPVPGTGARGWTEVEPEPEMDDEAKLAMVESLARKFMRKVMAEREARLAGQVVAADFYLRQVTAIEVAFDLLTEGAGLDGWRALHEFRRGGHSWLEIAETPLSHALDQMRRDYWREEGESHPELCWGHSEDGSGRPEHPPERYCSPFVLSEVEGRVSGYRLEPSQAATGALSVPAAGYSAAQWAAMDRDRQLAARGEQHARDAAAQVEWERSQRRDYEERRDSDDSA